jgi:hypothetical protein
MSNKSVILTTHHHHKPSEFTELYSLIKIHEPLCYKYQISGVSWTWTISPSLITISPDLNQ